MNKHDLCENCHSRPGMPYSVYYGTRKESRTYEGASTTVHVSYQYKGTLQVFVCSRCIANDSRSRAFAYIFAGLFMAGFIVATLHFHVFDDLPKLVVELIQTIGLRRDDSAS